MNSTTEYDVKGCRAFWNGHADMIEVWGTCRADGQYVRYFQRRDFFDLRLKLYLDEQPGTDPRTALLTVCSAALAQARAGWYERDTAHE